MKVARTNERPLAFLQSPLGLGGTIPAAIIPPTTEVILQLVNKSGGAIAIGDVVVIDTADDTAFTTTTTGRAEISVGIAQAAIPSNTSGSVLVAGYATLVNVPSSMTRGYFLETYTVVKQATGNATRRSGSFGQFLTGGTTPTAWLWGSTDQTAGSGSPLTTKGDIWGYSTVDARIAVGLNGYVLTADSAQALGVKWSTPTSVLPWSYAKANGGLAGDGTTDDTAALQAWITSVTASGTKSGWFFFEPGTYLIAGNITLPAVSTSASQIMLTFQGPAHAPFQALGPLATPGGYAILKGTATTGTATIDGTAGSNIAVAIHDLICIGNNNPTITFWHLQNTYPGPITGLQISTVSYTGGATLPTHTGAYGITLPGRVNSNLVTVEVSVGGYYTGVRWTELATGVIVIGNCIVGVELPFMNHASVITQLQYTDTVYGVYCSGQNATDILLMDSQHGGGSFATVADIYDPSNNWYGTVTWMDGIGANTFTVSGGAHVLYSQIGQAQPGSYATPAIVLGTAAAAGAATTGIRSDSTIVAFDVTVPVTQALGDSAATGSAVVAARRDHKHGMPALSTATPLVESGSGAVGTGTLSSREDHVHPAASATSHYLVIASSHSTPLIFDDLVQTSAGDDLVYTT